MYIVFLVFQRPPSSGNLSYNPQDDAASTRSGDTPGPNGQSNAGHNLGDNNSEAGKLQQTAT